MRNYIIGLSMAVGLIVYAPSTYALSCVPTDMYLDMVVGDETTIVFTGTATEVKNHTQIVTVTKAHQGWISPKAWVEHAYSTDWQYFCSNGPAKAGVSTVFLVTLDQNGSYTVMQTLQANSELAKDLIENIGDEEVDAGITEANAKDRAESIRESMNNLIKLLLNMLQELRYWEGQK